PPIVRQHASRSRHFEPPPHLHLLAIDGRAKTAEHSTGQYALHLRFITAGLQQIDPTDIRVEHARRFAAPIHAQVERIEWKLTAGKYLPGAALPQVVFAGREQLAGDFASFWVRRDQQETGCPLATVQIAVVALRAESGVDETNQPRAITRDDQPPAIEPRLGEDVLFEELRRHRLDSATNGPLGPPDFG